MRENQSVSRGQLLFRLDDQPYRTALARIEAEIEIQRAEIRGLRAQWRTKREDIKAAQSQQNYAQADYDRQKDLADRKFAPAAKMEESRMGLEVARQRIASAEEDLQRIEAALAGDPKIKVDDHPKVKQMLAARDEALHNLRRTTIEAPLDGVVSKVLVPGSYAVMGVPSMPWLPTGSCGSRPTSRKPSSRACASASRSPSPSTPIPTCNAPGR